MKAVILAGGLGTRISEESYLRPKPMIEIGGYPILWHILKIFYSQGINEFIICAGYKQHMIKEYFADYFLHRSDITFDFTDGEKTIVHSTSSEKWKITVVDTGLNTQTGHDAAVLAARNADDGVAAFSVVLKPIANPLHDLVFHFFCIECFHIDELLFDMKCIFAQRYIIIVTVTCQTTKVFITFATEKAQTSHS